MTNIRKNSKNRFNSYKGNMHEGAAELLGKINKLLVEFIEKLDLPLHSQQKLVLEKMDKAKIPMNQIEKIVNELIPEKYPSGLRTKSRKADLMLYKHITWYILRQMGYMYPEMREFFNCNHSTILHSNGKIKKAIQVNDLRTVRIYYRILTAIQDTHDRNLQNITTI